MGEESGKRDERGREEERGVAEECCYLFDEANDETRDRFLYIGKVMSHAMVKVSFHGLAHVPVRC